jgi:hypothetical protein
VVYKTLLRSVKRYYSNEFEARTEYSSLSKSKQEKRCLEIIERFTKNIFSEYLSNDSPGDAESKETIDGKNFDLVSKFVLSLVVPSYIKRNLRNTKAYSTFDMFYECLYRYSHKRLEGALKIPEIACVFKIFLNSDTFENLLESDATLSKNKEAYEAAKQEFMEIINKVDSN